MLAAAKKQTPEPETISVSHKIPLQLKRRWDIIAARLGKAKVDVLREALETYLTKLEKSLNN